MAPDAHVISFACRRPGDMDRISFALIGGEEKTPHYFVTVRELDSESVYIQHGGLFPLIKGQGKGSACFSEIVAWLWGRGYKRINFLTENTNTPMIKLGLNNSFKVVGMRVFEKELLLEMLLERGEKSES